MTPKQKDKSDKNLQLKKKAFLSAIALTGNITQAAKAAKVARQTHYDWIQSDPEYLTKFYAAMDEAIELLEAEARRRAYEGCHKPIYQGGVKVGEQIEYSDTLMIFLLKGARPEKYRDNIKMDVNDTTDYAAKLKAARERVKLAKE